jgi:hypothetical protein
MSQTKLTEVPVLDLDPEATSLEYTRLSSSPDIVFRHNLPMRNRGVPIVFEASKKNQFDSVLITLSYE